MKNMTISDKIKYLSAMALCFDFEEYLNTNNKEIIIFEIDTINERYILKEGRNFDQILENSNQKFFHSKAGYLVDIKTKFNTKVEADLFLLSDVVLSSNPTDLDTIIIHELVHMLIDSGQNNHMAITEYSREIGSIFYKQTDYPNEDITKHTEDFCQRLAQACITYNNKTKNFENDNQAIRSAMRFDIFE